MNDSSGGVIKSLQAELREFAHDREWEKYHTPRNLSALIASEAGELLALYRWDDGPDDPALVERWNAVEEEVADVFLAVLRFADVAGIDLGDAGRRKIKKNAEKYPAGSKKPDAATE
jgi:NTP pyrophosphatase (non-canonical NTP hydrolase)